jgi:uncharacterized protein
MIIEQTLKLLKSKYWESIKTLTIDTVRIGISMTAVRLSDGSCGVASTVVNNHRHCKKNERDYGDFSPLKIRGQQVMSLLETSKESGIITTLRVACLNAISSKIISSGNYKIVEDCDPINMIDLRQNPTVTVIGAFHSYISKIAETGSRLYVLELNENALSEDQKQFYVPANESKKVIPDSDIVIVTGLTLVNNTIDNLLASIPERAFVAVVGPSGSIIPDVLFANNVKIIGATRITKPDILFDLISEGGGGYHLFNYCAQKICILGDYEA